MRTLFFLTFLLASSLATAADPLQLSVRPQLPATVTTVAQAAEYYLAPTGYQLAVRTPVTGDARPMLYRPVRAIPADAPLVTIETALLAIVPTDVHLFVDHARRTVAFGDAP